MDFRTFKAKLEDAFSRPLPGQQAHYKMMPPARPLSDLESIDQSRVKQAAVAALFHNNNGLPHLILTLRKEYPGVHSGQISLPGGRKEKTDESFMHTALRETHEEIGIAPGAVTVLGSLTAVYIPPSNFYVYPFVGMLEETPQLIPEEREVEEIISLDFNEFLLPGSIHHKDLIIRGLRMKVPAFSIGRYTVWGATAMMISEIREMLSPDL